MARTSLVLLLVFAALSFSSASAATAVFQSFARRDGLAADYVNAIALAGDNAVWIGTPRGATNILGKYWVTYTATHGLGADAISALAVGPGNRIYLATSGGGLTISDSTRRTINTANSAIPSNYLTAVAVDKQSHVWVGTYGSGVGRMEGDQWFKYTLGTNYINAIALDASGNPWVATGAGAFFFDGKTWTALTQATGLASSRVYAVAVAPDGRIWFGTDNGATVYDGRRYRTYRTGDGLANNQVLAVAVDSQNHVWLGTARGLSFFDGTTWKTYTRADGLADDQVTALALDADKNVWVGTTHGLSALAAVAPPRPTSLPVVLVHGWTVSDSDTLQDSEFRFLKNYMEEDGIAPFYAAGILPTRTLFQNAATLRDVIADVKARTGSPQVDIIAFSMGGLNTRAYLESTLYQNDVRRAIILGTPEAGVRLWYPLLTREIEDRPNEPSAIELTPEYADLFNRTHSPRVTLPYDLLIGDARNQVGLELLKPFPPNDGLIDTWSAHALSGPLVRHTASTDVHAWNPEPLPFTITSYLYPEQTYDRFLRNALRDPDARPIGFSATPVAAIAPRNTTPLNVDTLRAGDVVTRVVDIDAVRTARFFARWNTGDITMTLRAPDGARYTSDEPRQATYLKADQGSLAGYSVPQARAGAWTVIVTRADKGSGLQTITTYADLDSDLRLNAAMDRAWYPLGASAVVSATLSNRAAGADVRARVEWLGDGTTPRGASVESKLLEEGSPGTYAEALTDLKQGGYYLVHITARGTNFTRERQLLFSVSPGTARFAGPARARVDGAAGDYTALTVDVPVSVARTGAFALAATLRNPKGELVESLTAPMTLTLDAKVASISIPGRDLSARGIDGPYTVDLTLMDASWAAVPVDEAPQAVTTEAYRANDFGERQ